MTTRHPFCSKTSFICSNWPCFASILMNLALPACRPIKKAPAAPILIDNHKSTKPVANPNIKPAPSEKRKPGKTRGTAIAEITTNATGAQKPRLSTHSRTGIAVLRKYGAPKYVTKQSVIRESTNAKPHIRICRFIQQILSTCNHRLRLKESFHWL